ncbi:dihydrodipicolinate synthase family protein [Falsigemmobacter faecalis]|uniref:Dihydrodipicolinate synthase family protein n=1 Tax=Falsigemmobacter faecalis TaxID=2488730 RepID=A0A3P3D920_9RHOB|nr:dihydrodipicolinate synthase family protein [Falsigemmobacter faecalis]RRH70096.1 dihydrodipicolinate synthase family protein [Falsigemmobacter faecalis]
MPALTGLSAFPITPADPDGRVATATFTRTLDQLITAGVDSLGVLGSTGGYMYLTAAERARTLSLACEVTAGRVPLLAGVGALSTRDAVAHARAARKAGAAAGLLAMVSYTPLTEDEIVSHTRRVSEDSGLPLCIYDNPGTTRVTISDDLLARLAELPGVIAVKNPAADPADVTRRLSTQRRRLPGRVSIGFSADWHCAGALLQGADTWYSVLAGTLPHPCVALAKAARRGDVRETTRLQLALEPVWDLFRRASSFRVVHEMARQLGQTPFPPPEPILPVSAEIAREIKELLTLPVLQPAQD